MFVYLNDVVKNFVDYSVDMDSSAAMAEKRNV